PIGEGNATKRRLSADPVIAGGTIFTQDSAAGVRAFNTSGRLLWSTDLTPASDQYGQASGGGLAFGGGRLFATTGYGEVIALDAETGAIFWRHKMGSAISAAPVVIGDHVIVVARNNIAQSLTQSYGRIEWEQRSTGEDPGLVGAGAPAALPRLAVLPFTNGELIAALTLNGQRVWSTAVTGTRVGLARSQVADISGDPVIAGDTVYAANQSGRLVSVDRRTGDRNWTAQDGSYSPVLPVAGSVFMITDTAALKRLDASDGSEIWSVELPEYEPVGRWRRTPLDAYVYYGPVLAGGRLIVAGSDGVMRHYDPQTGAALSTFEIPGGAASHVAIAGGRLYIVSGDGKLHAFQ
ncbi:MAG TPA: PQQ-binding-like beta-propeller repeat protein, partial [Afifellaceae bacterium]|nr:PQQ-binding-like beta-propeller repeat protein [Afifellaceae bacterium]